MKNFKSLTDKYLTIYQQEQPYTLQKHFNKLKKNILSQEDFNVHSAVYSSMIEGSTIDASTFWKYKEFDINTNQKPYKEIQDLIKSYDYAQKSPISWRSLMKTHNIMAATLLKGQQKYQGKIRNKNIGVYHLETKTLLYTGAETNTVKEEIKKLLHDIKLLTIKTLSIDECFYYAAMIHLRLAQIHPFADGNGRVARLLEKWFLAQKLGEQAWLIPAEKYYQKNRQQYYKNINLGKDYQHLNDDLCLPFLLMLPKAFTLKNSYTQSKMDLM